MLKAMLVDDEKIALDVLEILLNEIGGVEVAARSQLASDALKQAEGIQPDLIFLDIEMPGMNGLSAGKQLAERCPDAEIIFVTAYHQYALEAFDVRAIDYLLKPVAKERLQESLRRFERLRRKRSGTVGSVRPEAAARPAAGASDIRLRMMGSLELCGSDGKPVTWRTKKTKELFAYLWCHQGVPVYRDHLLDELWPDAGLDKAQALLHTTLYNLRSMLKAGGFPNKVEFGDERYRMSAEEIVSDVRRLEAALDGEPCDMPELLALYRGDFLEMEHYGWANARRLELRRKYIRHLERALEEADEEGRTMLQGKLSELDPI